MEAFIWEDNTERVIRFEFHADGDMVRMPLSNRNFRINMRDMVAETRFGVVAYKLFHTKDEAERYGKIYVKVDALRKELLNSSINYARLEYSDLKALEGIVKKLK